MKTILVVDDSPTVRQLIEINLRKLSDLRVVTAGDGKEALALLAKEKPALVLTDINMPEMNGLELLERIRATDKKLPVIVITTKGDKEDAEKAMSLGANSYVTKPINGAQLVETVKGHLG